MTDLVGLTKTLQSGRTLLGTGWKTVETFDDIDDEEYEEDEEEYVVMDLGTAMDGRTLQTEAAYQLIGMDTSMPFLKVGEHVFQGKVTGLIGDEVLFEVIRGAWCPFPPATYSPAPRRGRRPGRALQPDPHDPQAHRVPGHHARPAPDVPRACGRPRALGRGACRRSDPDGRGRRGRG
ncbi:hypothetical protein VHUM_00510 [Vanrija humicola]|uniref:Transcription factor TFIIIC triple barrel domain-containing protein n=1 Tax=Vanrija humicola TaxID=5417 RepID=A0A7D9A2D8_VANHU|nr:hypothetical protein VHUM_00510 [Vanrija humicola]